MGNENSEPGSREQLITVSGKRCFFILLYFFMSGQYPFHGDSNEEILKQIVEYDVYFDHPAFEKRSDLVLDLIERLLVSDPRSRMGAADALKHSWFR